MSTAFDLSAQLTDPTLFTSQAYLNGHWCDAETGKTIEVVNPATGDVIATVPDISARQVTDTIEFAQQAWSAWRETPAAERAERLMDWYHLMIDHQADLALIMTLEQGKPLAEARGEIVYAASFIKWFAEEARRSYGQTMPAPAPDRRLMTIKQPVGVCAAITPWNFPAAMITRKCAPALAAGCPIIVKPADLTPLSALSLAVLAERAGIPAGIFNVVTGDAATIGQALTENSTVRKITFTGSTGVGRLLMQQSATNIKRLSLELGGNAPFVVFDDADIDQAITGLMQSKFRNAGQTCVCANRILVQNGIYDRFAERLQQAMDALVVGNGLDAATTIGPLINQAAVQKVREHIDDALTKGATLYSGEIPTCSETAEKDNNLFVTPTILTNATPAMRLAQEETFGPLAPLIRFQTEAEALEIANDTPYGLGAYYYTQNIQRAWRFGEALEVGMVGLNTGVISMDAAPFGGIKQSGLGREGSSVGLDEYLEIKAWHIGGL